MSGDVRLLLWLRARHARTALDRGMRLFGVGGEAAGWGERTYRLYALGLAAVWTVLMWWLVLDVVQDACALVGAEAAVLAARAALAACALGLLAAGAGGLRASPLKLSHADIAHVAASPVSARAQALVAAGAQALGRAVAGAAVGFLLGAGLESAGAAAGGAAAAGFAALGALAAVAVTGTGWLAGAVRLSRARWGARQVAAALAALAAAAGAWAALALAVGPAALGALAAALALATFALLAGAASRMDMTAVIKESALYADLRAFGPASPLDERTRADYVRRRKLANRLPRFALPPGSGRAALVARAALSHARQHDGLPALVLHGTVAVPLGVLAVLGTGGPVLFLFWLQVAALMPQGARELSRVFRDDLCNRLVRDRLPFDALELLAFDSLPAFALTTALACAVCTLAAPPGVSAAAAAALAVLVNVCLLAACGLDAVRLFPGGPRPCYEYGAIALVAVAFGLSLLAPVPAVALGVAVTGTVFTLIVRFGAECAR